MAVKNKGTYKWLLVASLWVIGCLNYMDRQAIFSAFPLLKKELSMSDVQLGLLGSAFLWCYSASSPLAGYLGDRFKRKSVILGSLFIFSLATFANGLAIVPAQLIWLRGLLGLSEALYLPAALALIADYHSGGTRSTAIGLHQTSLLAGGILGAIFAGYMGEHYGWRNAFYCLGVSGILITFLMMVLIRETAKGESDFSTTQEVRVITSPLLTTLRSIVTTPTVLAVMFCGLSISMTGWLVMAWMPAYLYERFGLSLTKAAFDGVFYISVTTALGILFGSVLADCWARRDRRGRMWVQFIGLGLGFPAIAYFGFTGTAASVLVCLVVFGFARGLWDCNNMPIFCDVVPPASRSTTYGVFNLANTLGGGVSVIIAGILKQRLGIGLTLSMFSLMLLASAILTWSVVKRFLPSDMKRMREAGGVIVESIGNIRPTIVAEKMVERCVTGSLHSAPVKRTDSLDSIFMEKNVARVTRFRWTIVAILCAVAFVLYVDRVNISVSAPHIAAEFGLNQQAVGNVLSAFLFGYAFGLIPGGWLADRFGAHKVLTVAGVSWAILTAAAGLLRKEFLGHTFDVGTALFVMRFLLGLAEACAFPTFACALANWMRRSERAMASGVIHMGSNLGGVFAPISIAYIVGHLGWRYSFLFSGALTLAAAIWWRFAARDNPSDHPRVSESELRIIASDKEEVKVQPVDAAWYRRLVRSRNAYMLCVSEVFYGLSGFVFITWFYIYYSQVRGGSAIYSALLTSLTYVTGAIGALLGGILCDRSLAKWGGPWGRRIVPLVAIVVSGLCCILAPALSNNTASGVVYALAAGLQYLAAPAFWATVIDITRRGPGIIGGFMNGSGNLGAAIGTITFPWIVSHVGYQFALQLAGVAGLISGFVWLLIDSSRGIDVNSPQAAQEAV